MIWQYRYGFIQGLREGVIQETLEALSFCPGRAKRAGIASGEHSGFSVSDGIEARVFPGLEAESFRQSDALIHGRSSESCFRGPEPKHPPWGYGVALENGKPDWSVSSQALHRPLLRA